MTSIDDLMAEIKRRATHFDRTGYITVHEAALREALSEILCVNAERVGIAPAERPAPDPKAETTAAPRMRAVASDYACDCGVESMDFCHAGMDCRAQKTNPQRGKTGCADAAIAKITEMLTP